MKDTLKAPKMYLKNEKVSYLKTKLQLLNGELFLTQNQLILISNKTTIASGLLGRFIKKKIESNKYGFNIELRNITDITQGKHGVQKNILEISDNFHNRYRIIVKSYSEWEMIIRAQKSNNY